MLHNAGHSIDARANNLIKYDNHSLHNRPYNNIKTKHHKIAEAYINRQHAVAVARLIALRIGREHLDHLDGPKLDGHVQWRLVAAALRHVQVQVLQDAARVLAVLCVLFAVHQLNVVAVADGVEQLLAHERVLGQRGHVQRVVAEAFLQVSERGAICYIIWIDGRLI